MNSSLSSAQDDECVNFESREFNDSNPGQEIKKRLNSRSFHHPFGRTCDCVCEACDDEAEGHDSCCLIVCYCVVSQEER